MSQQLLEQPGSTNEKVSRLLMRFRRKIRAYPPGICPLTVQLSLLQTSMNQTCGKCVPCRDGLVQLERMLKAILDGEGTLDTLEQMRTLAALIRDTADCAIGYESAEIVLEGLEDFKDEYLSHITAHQCREDIGQTIPCTTMCPAHVDVPGYIALIKEGRYDDAIRLIRRDNPFVTACGMVCEHPCEARCRRNLIDRAVNIRGLKKYAVDKLSANQVPVPEANVSTGKKIAVIGGGPGGLSAAYFLALMGHKVVVYEAMEELGGMLRYGIPNYRFPKNRLDEDIQAILSAGDIEVKYRTAIGKDIPADNIYSAYDAVFIAVGAQKGKKLRIEGEDSKNVYSAVDILRQAGRGEMPDFSGRHIVVVGGGNVAMDCARSAVRAKAESVTIVYRRRKDDMGALAEEIEGAVEEGVELMTLLAPVSVEADKNGACTALWAQPQKIGTYDKSGRPAAVSADKPAVRIPCDTLLIAIGQEIDSQPFKDSGIRLSGPRLLAGSDCRAEGDLHIQKDVGIFAGGDCVTGPATVIKAIAAGKVAAFAIDEYLGYHHKLDCGVTVPEAEANNRVQTGRSEIGLRPARLRRQDFEDVENTFSDEEAVQEAGRCLRCDHYGCGILEGGAKAYDELNH